MLPIFWVIDSSVGQNMGNLSDVQKSTSQSLSSNSDVMLGAILVEVYSRVHGLTSMVGLYHNQEMIRQFQL